MTRVQILKSVLDQMLAHAKADPAIECCGLLAGRDGIISMAFPARNALVSPEKIAAGTEKFGKGATAYEIAPSELFALLRRIRAESLDLLGIYHSHPNTENAPSSTDIERAYYPDVAYLIISPRTNAAHSVRAFRIADGTADELKIEVI
jgi:proteasome lid subunit RPN8/RPN11